MNYNIAVIRGDGIGPEIVNEAVQVLDAAAEQFGFTLTYTGVLMGGCAIDETGVPLPEETVRVCKASDAVLLGAVGGPKWETLPGHLRPEAGLLGIRAALGKLFTWKACILLAVIMGSVVFYRPFCKWLCPLGAFYALLNKVSLFQMRVDTHKCVSCGACAKACKMDVDITKTPNHAECIRCGMCMKACPTDAIQYKFGLGDQSNTETTKE